MTEITNSDVTDAEDLVTSTDGSYTVTGGGMFDDLMESVNIHLNARYDQGQITGTDFANVYLSAMQTAMGQAVTFVLGKYRTEAEIKLIEAQTLTQKIEAAKLLADLKKNYGFGDASYDSITGEFTLGASTDDGLIDKQILLTIAQEVKVESESSLLVQKTLTELAQTSDTPTVTGVLGKQKKLFEEQTKGFYWNAQNKHLKAFLDGQAVNANIEGDGIIGTTFGASQVNTQIAAGKPSP